MPESPLSPLRLHVGQALHDFRLSARILPARVDAYVRARYALRSYALLDEAALRSSRRSDTVFVFGSGYSINALGADDVAHFQRHDTLGFNWFVHQRLVRVDYHLIREISEDDFDPAVWRAQLREYFGLIRSSPYYRETIFLVQSGLRALNGNRALGLRLLPSGARVFRWRSVVGRRELGRSFADGLSHPFATLDECVNLAALAGWREIVLVGVDLYDRRYFWLRDDETRTGDAARGASYADIHSRATSGMIENMGAWAQELEAQGVKLSVYNPRSLLTRVLPVYER